jgi:hypothetical protein
MGKKSRSGSRMNIPDHFSESLETIFGLKILKLFNADLDPVSGIFLTLDPGWKGSAALFLHLEKKRTYTNLPVDTEQCKKALEYASCI